MVCIVVFCAAGSFLCALSPLSAAIARDGDCSSGLCKQQQKFNEQNPDSALHDTQSRPSECCDGEGVRYEIKPAPDKTWQRPFFLLFGLDKQRNTDAPGSDCGTEGNQKIMDREKGKYPEAPVSTGHFAMATNTWREAMMQVGNSPQEQLTSAVANMQAQEQGCADACSNGTCNALDQFIPVLVGGNPNVANEGSGMPCITMMPFRTISQAIWMVQQMYKKVYLPMAFLLLLPGALLLHLKVMMSRCIPRNENDMEDDSAAGPFAPMLRALIAVFLIPATQLILSFSIDVGNSMTFEVARHISPVQIVLWARAQFEARSAAAQAAQGASPLDPQPYAEQTLQMAASLFNMALGYGLLILAAFQLVMSCYLMLMGPIAAALYAWPGGVGKLFKPVFVNWVNAIITLSMWRFWWILIVMVMLVRVEWLVEIGEYVANTEWEALMLGCFLVMMTYVPFAPFELKPGELVDKLLEKAKEISEAKPGKKGAGACG